ncbi:MAG TPA: hypothetical protein VLC06_15760 [Polyangia bacterium]|jgi:hypothetical protein|nr:hypothetical protein [Polyangia bacterium]
MNASPTLRRPLSLVAAMLPLVLAACGRVPGQFEILNDQIPTGSGSDCVVPVSPNVYQGVGHLDLSIVQAGLGSAYFFFPLIENNLPGASGSLDPNEIQLSGFQVDIKWIDAPPPLSIQTVFNSNAASPYLHYQIPWSGGISSGGGRLSASVAAFPVALAQQLVAAGGIGTDPSLTVELQIQVLGTTNSGTSMQSDPFKFPVEVCSGCLVASVAPCPFTTTPGQTGNACNPAQDEPVDCCTENGALLCPPTVATQ